MVETIVLVGLLMVFAIGALIWLVINPEKPMPGLLPPKTDRL